MENYNIYIFNNLNKKFKRKNSTSLITNEIWYYDDNTIETEFYNCIYDAWINNYKYVVINYCENVNLTSLYNLLDENVSNDLTVYNSDIHNNIIDLNENSILVLNEKGMKYLLDVHSNNYSLVNLSINVKENNKILNRKLLSISVSNNNKVCSNKSNILKIGSFGFFDQMINKNDNYKMSNFVQTIFIDTLKEKNINCKYVNPFEEECDICFYSLFNYNFNTNINKPGKMDFCKYIMKDIVGYPIFIYYTPENESAAWTDIHNDYNSNCGNSYSVSFYQNSDTNLYFPLWVQRLYEYDWFYSKKTNIKLNQKTKFCTYIVSNPEKDTKRDKIFEYINNNYKKVDSIGTHLNNQHDNFVLPKDDYHETSYLNIKYHNNYKFNLCCENSESGGNLDYITEKIINAFLYNTVPIYLGAHNIEKYFNPNAFININNLTYNKILEKIKEVDNNDELYYKMLNSYPFNELKNYKEEYKKNIYDFIIKILTSNRHFIEQYITNKNKK